MAFILRAEMPMAEWVASLDAQIARSPSFFTGRAVILDLADLPPDDPDIPALVEALRERGIRILDIDGYPGEIPGIERWGFAGGKTGGAQDIPADPLPQPRETGMIVDKPVRSGQVIGFPGGDVTVLGAVASGAEVMAGGSIHIYGALRGRAIAGALGNPNARIFCHKLEAELVAIDGFYRTADDMPANLHGKPAQIWLADGAIQIAALG